MDAQTLVAFLKESQAETWRKLASSYGADVAQRVKDSTDLAKELNAGTKIIITTLQKFSFLMGQVEDLSARRFAVIIDEAHSSQSGRNAGNLRGVLAGAGSTSPLLHRHRRWLGGTEGGHLAAAQAKAMLVTRSRLHVVRYKQAFDAYITEKGYQDINALVAFSGTVEEPDLPDSSHTEASMNGFSAKELPHRFAGPDYQLLIVAEKCHLLQNRSPTDKTRSWATQPLD